MPPDREPNLENELRDLGPHIEYPPTPDLAGSVRARLEAEGGSSTSRSGPSLWWVAAAALVLLVAVPVFSLAVRDGVGGGAAGSAGSGGAEAVRSDGGMAEQATSTPSPEPTDPSLAAACASPAPTIEVRPRRAAPGERFEVRGRYFVAGFASCADTGEGETTRTVPNKDVRVEFEQDGETWRLGEVDADGESRLVARLEVPPGAGPGRATVRATTDVTSAETEFFVLDRNRSDGAR